MSNFKPKDGIERLVIRQDVRTLIKRIVFDGARLTRPDVFAEKETLQLYQGLLILAHIGLPRKMREATVIFLKRKCGEDSEMYHFLSSEYVFCGRKENTNADEIQLLKAIRDCDEEKIKILAYKVEITSDLPEDYIVYFDKLSDETRITLFFHSFEYCSRPLILLLQKLLPPVEPGENVPTEVEQLRNDKRTRMILEITAFLTWKTHFDIENDHNITNIINITSFDEGAMKQYLDKQRSWGMYDLWERNTSIGRRPWQEEAYDRVVNLLNGLDIPIIEDDKAPGRLIQFKISIPEDSKSLHFYVIFKADFMCVYAKWPYHCPEKYFIEMLKYFNSVNTEMVSGVFYLDKDAEEDSGNIIYRFFQLYSEAIDYSVILCYNIIANSMRAYEQYHWGMKCIMSGEQTADTAFTVASNSKYSNFCDWYDHTASPRMTFCFPGAKLPIQNEETEYQ